ncbi:hypothetical protein Acr_28g0004850 [Actinidia rufa]|uniref:Uncharacterized protein n=1 Tax=Actinidia rufa TaxID=165716 RepID=A0A7J0H9I1_9ERIC|nr:hypothetical protein Acr_28g0004850 [Actinidia rufa]
MVDDSHPLILQFEALNFCTCERLQRPEGLKPNVNPVRSAAMRSDGFKYLKENCPSLQSELLKTVAGCENCSSGGGKSRSVLAQLSDGGDTNGRRVRQRT